MYTNVGNKIKVIAQVAGWFWLIVGVIAWIYWLGDGENLFAWISLLTGICVYFSSWFTYGFGQLVEDVHAMRKEASEPVVAQNDELPEL